MGSTTESAPSAAVRAPAGVSPWARELPDGLGLWALWQEDFVAHDRDWFRPGFRAVAVQRFGVWRSGIRSRLLRAPLSLLYNWLYRRMCVRYGIELPYTVRLGRRVSFEHQGGIVIRGDSAIGDECVIRQGVTLGLRRIGEDAAPVLGRRVDVGAGAKILGAIRVGDGACIGANAVVLQDVPDGMTAVGIPARILPPRTSR